MIPINISIMKSFNICSSGVSVYQLIKEAAKVLFLEGGRGRVKVVPLKKKEQFLNFSDGHEAQGGSKLHSN